MVIGNHHNFPNNGRYQCEISALGIIGIAEKLMLIDYVIL